MKVKGIGIALLAGGLLLTGCSASSNKSDSNTLIIGTEGTFAPFSYHNDKDQLVGYDVEVAKAAAKKAGYKVEVKEAKWDSLIAGLDAKQYDIVANQVTKTDERKEKYLFSDTYTYSHPAVLTKKENASAIKSFDDLKGKKFSQTGTSNYSKLVQQYGGEIVSTNDWNENVSLVLQNRTFGTVNDTLTYLDYKQKKPNADLVIAYEGTETYEQGFLIRKSDKTTQSKLNKALKALKNDGTLKKLGKKYFGKDVSVK